MRPATRARVQFLEAAATAGLSIESHPHPLPGHEGEALALDVVRDGPPDADRLLVVSSGCHGVDGFCGSGVQVFALHDAQWRAKARDAGVATLYLHALNPYGFSHLRSTTHENVDLSRNFVDFSQPLPVNAAYREIAHLLIPPTWPPDASHQVALEQIIAHRSRVALLGALSRGQHEFAQGLFFWWHGAHLEPPHPAPGTAPARRASHAHGLDGPARRAGGQRAG